LTTVVSETDLYRFLTFQVPNLMSLFYCLGLTKVSFQVRDTCFFFVAKPVLTVRNCQHLSQIPSWRTTPYQLSETAYSINSRLPAILETVPTSATWGLAMPCLQGPTYRGKNFYFFIHLYFNYLAFKLNIVWAISFSVLP